MTRLTQQQRKARTRAALLQAGAEIFARDGFAAARIEEIAASARMTTGALYAHFKSKQGLFLAVFDEFAAQRVQDIERVSVSGPPRELSPRAGADQWMDQLEEAPWRFWLHLEFAHYASRDPVLEKQFASSVSAVRLAIERLIKEHVDRNHIELPVSPRWLATVIRALGMGLSLEHLTDPQAVPAEMYGQATELILSLLELSSRLSVAQNSEAPPPA